MIAWVLTIIAGFANVWLLLAVVRMHALQGAGAAQSDFDLYILLSTIGASVVVVSVLILMVGALVNIRTLQINMLLLKRPIVIACLLNITIPISLTLFLFAIY